MMPILTCSLEECDKQFHRKPNYIKKNQSGKFYCSTNHLSKDKRKLVDCDNPKCNKKVNKLISEINKTNHNFCSSKCYGIVIGVKNMKAPDVLYPNTLELRKKIRMKQYQTKLRKTLDDKYVRAVLINSNHFDYSQKIPSDHIKLKKAVIAFNRQLKNN